MWPLANVLVLNALGSFLEFFFDSHYSSNINFQVNFNVIEKRLSAHTFEFSNDVMAAANALAQNRFPDKFLFGAATSAYQIEGAYNSSGKGVSVWDYWSHNEQRLVKDKSNGDVACDSFHKYSTDVALVKKLGANVYRISLSWSRILPDGLPNFVNPEGITYYNELINSIILSGITPLVTIHHFDIPHKLQLMGGWTNPKIIDYFESYAKVAFTYFGDRVKHWITVNDPWELCNVQFGNALKPIYNDSEIGNYLCGRHVLLAHAKVYRAYHNEYVWLQNGKVGISLGTRWFEPEEPSSPEDAEATELSFQFVNYWFLNPLLGEHGDYPDVMKAAVDVKSALERFKKSRLPAFSQTEIDSIKGSLDFLGINFFTTYVVKSLEADHPEQFRYTQNKIHLKGSVKNDMYAEWLPYDDAYGSFDIKNTAENFGKLLEKLNNDYVLPQVYITANGYADFGEIYDVDRAVYHYDHLGELFNNLQKGIDVRGYIVWSLMDSFEWEDGYTKHFGLYGVDFNDKNLPRKEKLSTKVIKSIYESKKIPPTLTFVKV